MVKISVFPIGRKRISESKEGHPNPSGKSARSVYNSNPYTEQIVTKIDIQFGQINIPLESIPVISGHGFGEGSSLDRLKTCGGSMGNQSPKYLKNLQNQRREEHRINFNMAWGPSQEKRLRKGILPFLPNTKDLEPASDELVTIWVNMSSYPPVYNGVEKAITSSNSTEGEV